MSYWRLGGYGSAEAGAGGEEDALAGMGGVLGDPWTVWVSLEYENNLFLQSWEKANIGPVSFLLNGTLAGFYAGALLGYTIAKYAEKKTEDEKDTAVDQEEGLGPA